jgi:hypothetical protein
MTPADGQLGHGCEASRPTLPKLSNRQSWAPQPAPCIRRPGGPGGPALRRHRDDAAVGRRGESSRGEAIVSFRDAQGARSRQLAHASRVGKSTKGIVRRARSASLVTIRRWRWGPRRRGAGGGRSVVYRMWPARYRALQPCRRVLVHASESAHRSAAQPPPKESVRSWARERCHRPCRDRCLRRPFSTAI